MLYRFNPHIALGLRDEVALLKSFSGHGPGCDPSRSKLSVTPLRSWFSGSRTLNLGPTSRFRLLMKLSANYFRP